VETLAFFKHFYRLVADKVGESRAGEHFVAITDPASHLTDLGERYGFRAILENDPNIGGRYSALTYFGLFPALLVGVDVRRLLDKATTMLQACESCVGTADNPAARLGAVLGELAKSGRDKLTIVTSDSIASFGDWVEQLIAESTGKEGKGIIPVVNEPLGPPDVYGDDRLFVHLRLAEEDGLDGALDSLAEAGHPVVHLHLKDRYDLGGQITLWEMATAIAGYRLNINPFDQPNVESAKVRAKEMVAAYQQKGSLPEETPSLTDSGLQIYSPVAGDTIHDVLEAFLQPGDTSGAPMETSSRPYIALQAFIQPTSRTNRLLEKIRTDLRDRFKTATTVGYGPRFLHSTGQLHKGDSGSGLFFQFTSEPDRDIPIPDQADASESSITFGVLVSAQAMGDRKALQDAGRSVLRVHLGDGVPAGLEVVAGAVSEG
jgi:hypothetical protein